VLAIDQRLSAVWTATAPQPPAFLAGRRGEAATGAPDGVAQQEPAADQGWADKNPIDWSSGDVAVWWTAAATAAVAAVNAEVAVAEPEPEPAVAAAPPTVAETMQLQLLGGDGVENSALGLAFVKATAAEEQAALPVVSNVKPGGQVAASGGVTAGLRGWRLLGIVATAEAVGADAMPAARPRAAVLAELKALARGPRPISLLLWPPLAAPEPSGAIIAAASPAVVALRRCARH
jgi:hypothetical protein